jgi:predicted nucleotidyltransferase
MTSEEYLKARESKNWKFNKIVSDDAFDNVSSIHPLKQKMVRDIVAVAREDDAVKKIIIFGSSTRYYCNVTSDLDLCIDWTEDCYDADGILKPFTCNMGKAIALITKGNADIVNYDYLDGTVIKDAVMEGVIVYDNNV